MVEIKDYLCMCGGKFKPFGKKTLKQFICSDCGYFVPAEKLYLFKKEKVKELLK